MTEVAELESGESVPSWPDALVDNFDDAWPSLVSDEEVRKWVMENKKVLVRTVTWNLCANPPPVSNDVVTTLLPRDRFHIYVIGTEECERSIARSAINPSKKSWEAYLIEAIGPKYVPLRSHTLQAIHLIAFVHKAISHMCSVVTSAAVPTGMGSTLGNKGGVGLYFQVGNTKLLIVNAHLAAHQTAEKRRNAEFNRINRMIPALLEKKEAALVAKTPTAAAGGGRFSLGFMSTKVSPTPGGTKQSESASGTPTKADSIVAVAPAHAVLPGVETIVNEQGRVMGEVAYGEDEGSEQGESRVASPKPTVELDSIQEEISPLTALATVPVPEVSADAAGTTRRCEGGVDAGSVATGNLDASGAAEVEAAIAGESAGSGAAFNTNAAVGSDAAVTGGTLNSHVTSVTAEASSVIGMLAAAGVRATDEAPAFEDGDTDVNKVNALDGTAILDVPVGAVKTLERMADLVVFMGDLNYRIKGNRKIVSSLVANNMHEVLLHNDQLRWNMSQSLVLNNFTEGPLNFKPTYKYDVGSDEYDTSSKGRIPSWTDRILYVPRAGVACTAYSADDSIRTSDHRPVYASFRLDIQLPGDSEGHGPASFPAEIQNLGKSPEFTSESQVCTIM